MVKGTFRKRNAPTQEKNGPVGKERGGVGIMVTCFGYPGHNSFGSLSADTCSKVSIGTSQKTQVSNIFSNQLSKRLLLIKTEFQLIELKSLEFLFFD